MKRITSKGAVSQERNTSHAAECKAEKAKQHNFKPQICARSNLILAGNTKKEDLKSYQRLYREAQARQRQKSTQQLEVQR